ncbi:MAG: hypothetical protein LUG24_05725 [Clostridiales bacterium]|nr:hypothetical protein [Clostridiales bacterium]
MAENTEKLTRQMAERQEQELKAAAAASKVHKGKLVKCPCCKMEISPNAHICPYCHEYPEDWVPFGLWPPLF